MELIDIQKVVSEFTDEYDLETSIEIRALDFISETGELAKEVLKGTSYGKKPFEITKNFESELGDAFFSMICIANNVGLDLEEALNNVIVKYKDRYEKNGSMDSGR